MSKENVSKVAASEKKPNFFVRVWRKLKKFCYDTIGELKKVAWTPKNELKKNTKLVIVTVVVVCLGILAIDLGASWIINSIAGLVG